MSSLAVYSLRMSPNFPAPARGPVNRAPWVTFFVDSLAWNTWASVSVANDASRWRELTL
jgi:hypothetical protein